MRCFVAIKATSPILTKVAAVQEELRGAGADVRWIGPQELHLTLRFFGDLEDAAVSRLSQALGRVAATKPKFTLTYAGLGEFPRVVWIGGSHDADPLAAAIEAASGLPPDRYGFTPHLTIGRIRSDRGSRELAAAIAARKNLPIGADPVTEFLLIKSTLLPQGPVYETLETFPLA